MSPSMAQVDTDNSCCSHADKGGSGVFGMGKSRFLQFDNNFFGGQEFTINSQNASLDGKRAEISHGHTIGGKLKFPLLLKDKFKMIGGLKYYHTEYQFDIEDDLDNELASDLDDKSLKHVGFNLYGLYTFNNLKYLAVRGSLDFRGDHTGFLKTDGNNLSFSVTPLYGFKPHTLLEFGFGLAYSYNFGFHTVLPVFLYNHTFSPKWGLETMLPKHINVRYNVSDKTILYAGAEAQVQRYLVNLPFSSEPFRLRTNAIDIGLQLEQQIIDPVWIGVNAGYRHTLSLDVATIGQARGETYADAQLSTGSWYAEISIFIVPPKKLLNKRKK